MSTKTEPEVEAPEVEAPDASDALRLFNMPKVLPTPKKPKGYTPPKPARFVLWSDAPGGQQYPAAVTAIGKSALNLVVFPPDMRGGLPKDGVRHVGDPHVRLQLNPELGVWDYTDEFKLLLRLAEAVYDLSETDLSPDLMKLLNQYAF